MVRVARRLQTCDEYMVSSMSYTTTRIKKQTYGKRFAVFKHKSNTSRRVLYIRGTDKSSRLVRWCV